MQSRLDLGDFVKEEKLDLFLKGITNEEIETLVIPYLKEHPEISDLNLSHNQLTHHAGPSLKRLLTSHPTLIKLHLQLGGEYGIGDKGASAIAETLAYYPNLKLEYLDLSLNRITDDGAKLIAKELKDYPHLKTLNLRTNRITDFGIKAVVSLQNVDALHLENNLYSKEGWSIVKETDPMARMNHGRNVGIESMVPSLYKHTLFQTKKYINEDKIVKENISINDISKDIDNSPASTK